MVRASCILPFRLLPILASASLAIWICEPGFQKTVHAQAEPAAAKTGPASPVAILTGHKEPIGVIAFAPDGKTLASGSHDRTAKIWDVATGKEKSSLAAFEKADVECLAFSRDGKMLATGSGSDRVSTRGVIDYHPGIIKLWETKSGKELGKIDAHPKRPIDSLAFSPDGKVVASSSFDDAVHLWDVATLKEVAQLKFAGREMALLLYTADGKTMITGNPGLFSDKPVIFWDLESRKERSSIKREDIPKLKAMAITGDGKTLAIASGPAIHLVNTGDGKIIRILKGHKEDLVGIAVTADGKTLVSAEREGTVKLWNMSDGKEKLSVDHMDEFVWCLALSDDGKKLAIGGHDGTGYVIKLWDLASLQK